MKTTPRIAAALVAATCLFALSACVPALNTTGTPAPADQPTQVDEPVTEPTTEAPVDEPADDPVVPAAGDYCTAWKAAYDEMQTFSTDMQEWASNQEWSKIAVAGKKLVATFDQAAALATDSDVKQAIQTLSKGFGQYADAAGSKDLSALMEAAKTMMDKDFMSAAVTFGMEAGTCG
ncbi:MAG: hypothetical protein LBR58_06300 [Propionibacteriaceae bacterium]|jgi:hypothetical protein|nr:hypothetical protein [Propionibacteriaceae bacterium]